jgi:RND family efflux transporter MFP subunit
MLTVKKWTGKIGIAVLIGLLATGCGKVDVVEVARINKPVEVMSVTNQEFDLQRLYSGRIGSDSVQSLSFMSSGKIVELNVKAGDQVKKNQLIARLDSRIQSNGVSSSSAQVEAATQLVEKAKAGLRHLEKTLEDMKVLHASGAISDADLKGAELQVEIARSDLNAAQAQVKQAKAGLGVNSAYLRDTKLYAPRDGVIMELLNKKGDIIQAGYPVMLMEGEQTVATFGMSQATLINKDYQSEVVVVYGDENLNGTISNIHKVPDPATQTYQVDVALPDGDYLIGASVDIFVKHSTEKAVKLPMNIVLSGENDFVFVVENGKAIKTNVRILSVQDNFFYVEGLKDGQQVVIKGMKLINSLDDVEIVTSAR